ncbi:TetR/AcrR family transcriptional regulator [Salinicoccus sesuvii]|uniref:TetR/AcrR family transcriptional regulator n=1 Tax=Salinicoccus sesuvii TaxID=868281 RepID=A0ABV7N2W1_9STAP
METKESIIVESRNFFGTFGYEATSMSMIAEAVAIKKPSLYSHYKSKEDIFKDVLDKEMQDYIAHLKSVLNDNQKRVMEILHDLMKTMSLDSTGDASADFYYRYARYQPQELKDYIMERYTESENTARVLFDDIIERGKREGEIDAELSNAQIYSTYFLLLDGLAVTPDFYGKTYQEGEFDRVWEVFQRGIRPASV